MSIISPANFYFFGIAAKIFAILIPIVAVSLFLFIIKKRLDPLLNAAKDDRFNNFGKRIKQIVFMWLLQKKQPRYFFAGVLHIVIFFGFLALAARSISLVFVGIFDGFYLPGFSGVFYNSIKDIAATLVLIACIIAAIRRGIFKPKRYSVPEQYGKDHTSEAVFVLLIISVLMLSESLFEATLFVANGEGHLTSFTLPSFWVAILGTASIPTLQKLHIISYFIHDITFFFFLCFLPFGKHFHVITSFFNVFFMRLQKGNVKPVKYGVSEDEIDSIESFGVKKLSDFTWKHLIDFYSCADCGRCSDNCPANTVGRPLSPRFLTIKARDYIFKNYPIFGKSQKADDNLIGTIYSEDEIWSCTTCGACEEECPLANEYIDKIVDLRRGMIDEGLVPQSLQKPLQAIEKRGNPYGKTAKKRIEWTKAEDIKEFEIKDIGNKKSKETAENLFFVDSISSFDDRMIEITKSTAKLLKTIGYDFGLLGEKEKDAGNEVKRFGEEMLFCDLKAHNTDAILETGVKEIVTADPHTLNTLNKDYKEIPKAFHISQIILRAIKENKIQLKSIEDDQKVFTYHDPCYLGRHNLVYDEPREVLDSIPGLKRVEMERSGDKSFCCGGGGLMLFYEPEEETRMGVVRVNMAKEAGASVIVTACPFCMANLEDAVKVSGFEGEIEVIDIAELVWQQM